MIIHSIKLFLSQRVDRYLSTKSQYNMSILKTMICILPSLDSLNSSLSSLTNLTLTLTSCSLKLPVMHLILGFALALLCLVISFSRMPFDPFLSCFSSAQISPPSESDFYLIHFKTHFIHFKTESLPSFQYTHETIILQHVFTFSYSYYLIICFLILLPLIDYLLSRVIFSE